MACGRGFDSRRLHQNRLRKGPEVTKALSESKTWRLFHVRIGPDKAPCSGYPAAVRTDNGPEFTSRAFIAWAQGHGIRHILIGSGRPMQNGYIESFNGRFRDDCLNEHWFETLHQARKEIAAWRRDYNEVRPHGSIGRIPPARFAEQHRRHAGDAARHLTPASNEIQ
jgi:putative transposase